MNSLFFSTHALSLSCDLTKLELDKLLKNKEYFKSGWPFFCCFSSSSSCVSNTAVMCRWHKQVGCRSPAAILSALPQAPRIQRCAKGVCTGRWLWVGGGGQTISAAVRRRGDGSLPRLPLSYAVCELKQVAARYSSTHQPHVCMDVSSVTVWKISGDFSHISKHCSHLLKGASDPQLRWLFVITLDCISLPPCWLGSRHKESLKDKARRCRCRCIIIKDPQFFHPLDIGPPFICGRLLIHATSQWGIPFSDNIIPSPVQTGYLLYSCLSPGESDIQPGSY